MAENKIVARIFWCTEEKALLDGVWQTKTFDSEMSAIEWIRRNSMHILRINSSKFFVNNDISHFEIMDALRRA